MAKFDREVIEQVSAACQVGIGEAAQAFGRTFDVVPEFTFGSAESLSAAALPPDLIGSGLIFVLRVGDANALVVLPASSGLVPDWCQHPDATSQSKLSTLAVEFGMLLLPETFQAMDGAAGYVRDLPTAIRLAKLQSEAARIAISIKSGDKVGTLSLLWPFAHADAALQEPSESSAIRPNAAQPTAETPSTASAAPNETTTKPKMPPPPPPARPPLKYEDIDDGINLLPKYSRSLLKIKVPVMVTLAQSKQPIEAVLDIGPGSIIHFNKSCEDTLTLEVAGHKVAVGEAVKVGDKFGLWITAMILPDERFWVISDRQRERAK